MCVTYLSRDRTAVSCSLRGQHKYLTILRVLEALLRIHVNLHHYRSLLPTCVRGGHCRTSARVYTYTYIYIYIYIYIYKLSSSRLLPGDGFSVVSLYDNISILLI